MKRRYITFIKLYLFPLPHIKTYGLMCTRNKMQCLKLGFKHIRKGTASFFYFQKAKPKRYSYFH